jgi:hypothetical protein
MSEIYIDILEKIEDGESMAEIAYEITCEHPVDYGTAYSWVLRVSEDMDTFAQM